MKKVILGAFAAAIVTTGIAYAAAHGDAVANRKNGMTIVGTSMGTLSKMAKGEMDFDAKGALAALRGMNYVATTVGDYFPEGSTGDDTTASPKIWEDMDGFKKALAKLEADTAAAISAAPADAAALGGLLGSIGGNCKDCHEAFRIKKS